MARARSGSGPWLALALAAVLPLAAAAAAANYNAPGTDANMHQQRGVGCADCHGKGKQTFVTADRCLSCHGPLDTLVQKTSTVRPINPHESPHWGRGMECNVCHRQHEPTINWCSHCHSVDAKAP